MTAGLLILTWVLANSINNLKLVLGFTGATGGCLLLYILPSLFYLKLLKMEGEEEEGKAGRNNSWSML